MHSLALLADLLHLDALDAAFRPPFAGGARDALA
jgi:hypothetical protein